MRIKKMLLCVFVLGASVVFLGCPLPSVFHTTFTISQDAKINDVLYVVDQETHVLHRSFDNGANFEETALGNKLVWAITTNSEAIYVVISNQVTPGSHQSLWTSYDFGQTFNVEMALSDNIADIDVSSDQSVYLAVESWGSSSGIWKKVLGGEWKRVALPGSGSYQAVDVDPASPNVIYSFQKPGGSYSFRWIIQSLDGGDSWLQIAEVNSSLIKFDRTYKFYQP